MNCVTLCGRVGSMTPLNTDTQYCVKFTIATQDGKKDANGNPTGNFTPCVAFGKTAEFFERYFKIGSWIGLRGRVNTAKYTDKHGETKYSTEIIAEHISFVGAKPVDPLIPQPIAIYPATPNKDLQ